MTRYIKDASGKYHIHGKTYEMLEGSRAQVFHGTAYKTSGGLKKHHILQNKNGRMVSRLKHNTAKKEDRLGEHGWTAKAGEFGPVRIAAKSMSKSKSRKTARMSAKSKSKSSKKYMRGGSSHYNHGYMGSVMSSTPQEYM